MVMTHSGAQTPDGPSKLIPRVDLNTCDQYEGTKGLKWLPYDTNKRDSQRKNNRDKPR